MKLLSLIFFYWSCVSLAKVSPPRLLLQDRTDTTVTLSWQADGSIPTAHELLMDDAVVYTGVNSQFTVQLLTPGTCYKFRVKSLVSGVGWTPFSATLSVTTTDDAASDRIDEVELRLSGLRQAAMTASLAEVNSDPCSLDGFETPDYLTSSVSSVSYTASFSANAQASAMVAAINCKLAKCDDVSTDTQALGVAMSEYFKIPADATARPLSLSQLVTRFVSLPVGQSTLSFTDPGHAGLRTSVSLLGCRAGAIFGRSDCFEVNCTASAMKYAFCVDDSAAAISNEKGSKRVLEWIEAINSASHGARTPTKFQTVLKAGLASLVTDNNRRERRFGAFEPEIFREAWMMTYLSALTELAATPAFPIVYSVHRCNVLPPKYMNPPFGRDVTGVIPTTSDGRRVLDVAVGVQMDGAGGVSGSAFQWGIIASEVFQQDVQQVLSSVAGAVFPPEWARSLLLQLVYAIAVGRHAFGLHHNSLLDLRNLKLQQLRPGSPDAREYLCFETNEQVLAGLPLKVRSARNASAFVNGRGVYGDKDFTFRVRNELKDACTSPPPSLTQTSWCVRSSDLDGFILKLDDFSRSSLSRKQLEWWAEGFAFPNTAWRDDLKDAALTLCPQLQVKVAAFDSAYEGSLAELCDSLRRGNYANNPAMALSHRLFSSSSNGLRTMHGIPAPTRLSFRYLPATIAEMERSPFISSAGAIANAGKSSGNAAASNQNDASSNNGDGSLDKTVQTVVGETAKTPLQPQAQQQQNQKATTDQPTADTSATSTTSDAAAGPITINTRSSVANANAPRRNAPATASSSSSSSSRFRVPLSRPWIYSKSDNTITVQWADLRSRLSMPDHPTYNLFVNGHSVYSGHDTSFTLLAPTNTRIMESCLIAEVAVFVPGIGWSERSPKLEINECAG